MKTASSVSRGHILCHAAISRATTSSWPEVVVAVVAPVALVTYRSAYLYHPPGRRQRWSRGHILCHVTYRQAGQPPPSAGSRGACPAGYGCEKASACRS